MQNRLSEDLKVMLGASFTTRFGKYKNPQNSWSKLNLWDTTSAALFDDNGEYAIAVSQICSIFSVPIKHASRDLKAILGAGFSIPKARTTLHSQPVNCVTLLEFERALTCDREQSIIQIAPQSY